MLLIPQTSVMRKANTSSQANKAVGYRQMDGTLSGGEMKRLEIATVLAKPHKVSIFDEPEAGIDLWSFSMLIKRFEEIHKEKKECLILISHQERIIQMADKIMVIEDGQVKEYGTKEDVLPTLFQQKTGRPCGQEGGPCCWYR